MVLPHPCLTCRNVQRGKIPEEQVDQRLSVVRRLGSCPIVDVWLDGLC